MIWVFVKVARGVTRLLVVILNLSFVFPWSDITWDRKILIMTLCLPWGIISSSALIGRVLLPLIAEIHVPFTGILQLHVSGESTFQLIGMLGTHFSRWIWVAYVW